MFQGMKIIFMMSPHVPQTSSKELSVGVLLALAMEYSISDAAEILGLGTTLLKRQCRRLKIMTWPYRAAVATRKMLDASAISPEDKIRIEGRLRQLATVPQGRERTPHFITNLRTKIYKGRHKSSRRALARTEQPLARTEQPLAQLEEDKERPWYHFIDVSNNEFDVPFMVVIYR
jgi:hypothetical protein